MGLDPSLRAFGISIMDISAKGMARRIFSHHEGTLVTSVPVTRFIHFQSIVKKYIDEYNPDVIGIESPAYDAGPFQSIHFGLMIFSLVPIFERRIDCALFDPATLKALAKGDPKKKGKMGKMEMQRAVQIDTSDPHPINDNEADAYLVALFTAKLYGVIRGQNSVESLSPAEKRVFIEKTKKIKTIKGSKIKRTGHVFRENNRFYEFSKVPKGSIDLPKKSDINPEILKFLGEHADG